MCAAPRRSLARLGFRSGPPPSGPFARLSQSQGPKRTNGPTCAAQSWQTAPMVSGNTLWADQLDVDELRALDPGPGTPAPDPDVLVVGGGMLGVVTALACQRAGLGRVALIEA